MWAPHEEQHAVVVVSVAVTDLVDPIAQMIYVMGSRLSFSVTIYLLGQIGLWLSWQGL